MGLLQQRPYLLSYWLNASETHPGAEERYAANLQKGGDESCC